MRVLPVPIALYLCVCVYLCNCVVYAHVRVWNVFAYVIFVRLCACVCELCVLCAC